jgi:hypothetical protein
VRKVAGIALVLFLALALQSVPVLAGDEPVVNAGSTTFHAFSKMTVETRASLVPMQSDQLVSVEGEAGFCVVCINAARVTQVNASLLSLANTQTNLAVVAQSN